MNRRSEKGQSLLLGALFLVAFSVFAAVAVDLPSILDSRRDRQKLADASCLWAVIVSTKGWGDPATAAAQSLVDDNNVDVSLFTPNEGTGTGLKKGIEIGGSVRVALSGTTLSWFSQFIPGFEGWSMGAQAHCQRGIVSFLPLAQKEWEGPGSKIYPNPKWDDYTPDPNDEWSGPCSNQSIDPNEVSPPNRPEPYCWIWGDIQVLAGDGHRVNEGGISMNGLIAPDVRCEHKGKPCISKVYIPPVPYGAAVNTLKSYTMNYIATGGYPGPLPIPGVYTGIHSALIAQQEGVSNKFLAQEIAENYGIGALLVPFVYKDGELFPGNKNYDYVEVIGYSVVRIVDIDANTIWIVPVYPEKNQGDPTTMEDDLPKSPDEIKEAGFDIDPILIPWD